MITDDETEPLPHEEPLQIINFGPFSHQDLINAASLAANTLHLNDPWALLTKCGLSVKELAVDRLARYVGVALHELPNLTTSEKNLLMQQMSIVQATMPVPPRLDPTTEPTVPPVVPPNPEPPVPPIVTARGNRLGFYLHNSTDQNNLWEAIQRVQPPVILIHADTANRMLLEEIRRFRAPDAFVVARVYKDGNLQRQMLDTDQPEAHGTDLAQKILEHDFGLATQRGANGRLLIDGWMSLNEAVPGPASQQFREQPQETARLLHNYDRFQVAFRQRLQTAGVEAVAFNFAAGNFSEAAHYLDHFPATLQEYRYLGFHEYGWPTLNPAPGSATSAGSYRHALQGIRARYGDRHRVIITELGLTRMYQNPAWGDKGWLNPEQPLSEEQYWQSLAWYNEQMLQDPYVLGSCLYEVGHAGDWESFRHLGQDNQCQSIHLIDRIVTLRESALAAAPSAAAAPALVPPTQQPAIKHLKIAGTVSLNGKPLANASVRLIGSAETVGALPDAALYTIGYVTWTRQLAGFSGSVWNCWRKEVAKRVAGISWPEFKSLVGSYNPRLADDGGQLLAERTYFLPENKDITAEIVWDRPLAGFSGNLWQCWQRFVANRVIGLTYHQFKHAMLQHNPQLVGDHGHLQAERRYNLPRNAGHTDYMIQTMTNRRGHFAFEDLLPGSYRINVRAEVARPFGAGFSCTEDVDLDIALRPKIVPAAAMPAAVPQPAAAALAAGHPWVGVNGDEFVVDGRAFRFIGVNIRGLVHYGDQNAISGSTENHRLEQLQAAYEMGARVVRLFLPCMHVNVGDTITRLRVVVNLVRERFPGLYILPAFANLYGDVSLRIRGDECYYDRSLDPCRDLLNATFFGSDYDKNYLPFVRQVVPTFRDEPIIFAWEIGNELKLNPQSSPQAGDPHLTAFLKFMRTAAQEIRNLDPRHLITTGMISTRHAWLNENGLGHQLYSDPLFNFLTVHCYNEEYENDDSELAQELNKPYIIEEAGFDSGKFGNDRSQSMRNDIDRWFGRKTRGYMPWGFMATPNDIGDGDLNSGFDRAKHHDWDQLYALFRRKAEELSKLDLPLAPVVEVPLAPPIPPVPLPSGQFTQGETIYCLTSNGVKIRRSVGHLKKEKSDEVAILEFGKTLTVTGPAQEKDGLTWWPVRCVNADGSPIEGWAAETYSSNRLLGREQPFLPAAAAAIPASLSPNAASAATVSTFASGQIIYAQAYVNLRHIAGTIGKGDDDVIGQIPFGAAIEVLAGPSLADGLTWWSVRATLVDKGMSDGWAAEADGNGLPLLGAEMPMAPPPYTARTFGDPLRAGDSVCVVANQVYLRRTAGYIGQPESHKLATLNQNALLSIVFGPQMVDDLEWWQVAQGQNSTGWVALTDPQGTRLVVSQSISQSIHVGKPFRESWLLTQGWGSWPEFYCRYKYDDVPLKGHNGLDFGTPIGTPILAVDAGEVFKVDFEPDGFGNHLLIRHAWGESLYAHLQRVDVGVGTRVAAGQHVGLSGESGLPKSDNTGIGIGPHLHFGIRIFPYRRTDGWGGFVDPSSFMKPETLLFPLASAAAFPTYEAAPAPMATELPGRPRP